VEKSGQLNKWSRERKATAAAATTTTTNNEIFFHSYCAQHKKRSLRSIDTQTERVSERDVYVYIVD
jgi:hypothetical protein